MNATHISIPTAGRAEFVVSAPAPSVKAAQFVTRNINTGPDGDNDPARPLAKIQLADFAVDALRTAWMKGCLERLVQPHPSDLKA